MFMQVVGFGNCIYLYVGFSEHLELYYNEEHNIRCLRTDVNMNVDHIYRVRNQSDIKKNEVWSFKHRFKIA